MDMSLPEVDGWEATRRLKAEAATRQIPVVALTAHAMESDRAKAFEAGCDDYETKPVDFAAAAVKDGNAAVTGGDSMTTPARLPAYRRRRGAEPGHAVPARWS